MLQPNLLEMSPIQKSIRYHLLLIIIKMALFAPQAQAQDQASHNLHHRIDSLAMIYKAAALPDSTKYVAIVDSLLQVSRQHQTTKSYQQALEVSQLSEQICRIKWGIVHPLYGSISFNTGKVYREMNQLGEAEKWYLKSLHAREANTGRQNAEYANTLNNLAGVKMLLGDLELAKRYYEEACEIRGQVLGKIHPDYSNCLENLGIVYKKRSDYAKAEQLYLEVKEIRKKSLGADHILYGKIISSLASVYKLTYRYQEAEQHYLLAHTIFAKAGSQADQHLANLLNNFAILYKETGRFESAVKLYKESIELKEYLYGKEHQEYGVSLANLANLKIELGQFKDAEELFSQAKEIFAKSPTSNYYYLNALSGLADIYHRTGNYNSSELYNNQVYSLLQQLKDKDDPKYGKYILGMAKLYKSMERFEIAEKYYVESMNLLARNKPENRSNELANCLNSFGNLLLERKQYKRAGEQFLKAKKIWDANLGQAHAYNAISLANLAVVALRTGEPEVAETLFATSDSIWNVNFEYSNENRIAHFQLRGKLYHETQSLEKAAAMLDHANRLAQDFTLKSVEYLSDEQLNHYAENLLIIQNRLLSIAHHSGAHDTKPIPINYSTLYTNALYYKALILNARLYQYKLASEDSATSHKLELLKAAHRNISNYYSNPARTKSTIDSLTNTVNFLQKDLARSVKSYGNLMLSITDSSIRKILSEDAASIEFVRFNYYNPYRTDSVLYSALIVSKDQEIPTFVTLFEENQVEAILNAASGSSRGHNLRNSSEEQSQLLYQLIWKPLEKQLQDKKTIYFSPVGLLNLINFDALKIDGKHILADSFRLKRLLSTRELLYEPINYQDNNLITLYGGINYNTTSTDDKSAPESVIELSEKTSTGKTEQQSELISLRNNWQFLKWTEEEVKILAEIAKNAKYDVSIFTRNQANENTLHSWELNREKSPRVLHFATHAYFVADEAIEGDTTEIHNRAVFLAKAYEQPLMRSGLIMAGSNPHWNGKSPSTSSMEDGILTAYEISQMNLSNTELVVLSACETGLGDIKGNEGVYGLQRAFKIAGAKYLIMSLWQVPDRETKEFMVSFYKNWLDKKISIPEAFRMTQKEMRERFINPYAWAGFVLVE